MKTYKDLKEQYGFRFAKLLYTCVPKEWWDEYGGKSSTHLQAVYMAGLVMVYYKLDLSPDIE